MDKSILDHELVADACPRRVEDDALLAGEGLDLGVFLEVGLGPVLNVVVKGEDRLPGIGHVGGADGAELGQHCSGVVVGHHVSGAHGDHVARKHFGAGRETDRMGLNYLFGDCLWHFLLPIYMSS